MPVTYVIIIIIYHVVVVFVVVKVDISILVYANDIVGYSRIKLGLPNTPAVMEHDNDRHLRVI